MRLPTPRTADERASHRGRPYELWLPTTPGPWPGMVILHGAGSRKENHSDFARACAESGWAAITYDQRGHGESDDQMGAGAVTDVGVMARLLAGHKGVDPARICVRGSSMGGFFAVHAAAVADELAGVIAICPTTEESLRRGLRQETLQIRADVDGFDAWLSEHDIREAAELLGAKPLLVLHARGDERVPYTDSEALIERALEPKRLIVVPGGHHRSIQHDAELQGYALGWLGKRLATGSPSDRRRRR